MKSVQHYQVLLVDDEPLLSQSLRHSIEETSDDFRVCAWAANGSAALEELERREVHAVITDIRMPVMDGLELTEKVHKRYPDLPVVLLTGYADFQYARQAIRCGAMDYLLKPISDEDLAAVLNKLREELSKHYTLQGSGQHLSGSSSDGEETVRTVKEIFQSKYMEDLDLGSIAAEFGFSSAYLTKLFNKYVGETPLRFLTGIRIDRAKELLSGTSLSINEVGEQVGYPDQFHFSKTFRKITGVTPSAYRKGQ